MHRRTRTWSASAALALGLVLGGCATSSPEEPMTTASPEPVPTVPGKTPPVHPTVLPGTSRPTPTDSEPADARGLPGVQEAIGAEAQRQGVAPEQVAVITYAEVTWSDGSIGCPQPGMMYTQALVPGRHLELAVNGDVASYHAAADHGFSYCADPQPPLPAESDPLR